jgi:DNA invertase Pin-like site-specific DNA recombinase
MPELKVTADHLRRDAYLYVRQSTLRQVAEHGESTQRQYALRDRAMHCRPAGVEGLVKKLKA